jgi:hypothetical protein
MPFFLETLQSKYYITSDGQLKRDRMTRLQNRLARPQSLFKGSDNAASASGVVFENLAKKVNILVRGNNKRMLRGNCRSCISWQKTCHF